MTSSRRNLPPGARWTTLKNGEQRVEVVLNAGLDPRTGRRRQVRRRFRNASEARAAYLEMATESGAGRLSVRSSATVKQLCDDWLESRHGLRATTVAGYRQVLKPVVDVYGSLTASRLEKMHIIELIRDLQSGTGSRRNGQPRRPWGPRSVNLMLFVLGSVLSDAVEQGVIPRDVSKLVDRMPGRRRDMDTFTEVEVDQLLKSIRTDELEHVWHLALYGLRRGELAGLRWDDIDDDAGTLVVRRARVTVDGYAEESLPKTANSERTLPLSRDLKRVLERARQRQLADAVRAGDAYESSGFVAVDQIGRPLHPETLSGRWDVALANAGIKRIRLHDARHTCGTLLHLQGVPTALISAWLGHADAAFTMKVYVHSQQDVLNELKRYFERDELGPDDEASPDS